MGTAEMPVLETENASNQSPSSNDSASESDSSDSNSESDSSDSETTEQPAKVKSIFDISSSEEDNESKKLHIGRYVFIYYTERMHFGIY